jgi:hypothetical protein
MGPALVSCASDAVVQEVLDLLIEQMAQLPPDDVAVVTIAAAHRSTSAGVMLLGFAADRDLRQRTRANGHEPVADA